MYMGLELFDVIPVKTEPTQLLIEVNEELDQTHNEHIATLLKMFNINYNLKQIIKQAIPLNIKITLTGKVKKKKAERTLNKSTKLATNSLVSGIVDDEDYKEQFKEYLETLGEDVPKEPLFYNNRVEFLNEIMRKMISLKMDKDEASCEKTSEKDYKPLVHQMIVTRYLNSFTPYRGLLLYHGLGSGKTCSSISIIEGMKHSHKVFIMTPASLQANYRTQMKFCGDQLFKLSNNWVFIEKTTSTNYSDFFNLVGLNEKVVEGNKELKQYMLNYGGLWVIKEGISANSNESNYERLDESEKAQIDELIDILIKYKYNYINYNGITKKRWNTYTHDNKINPFDNSVIVIDEVHNFVSRIVNKLRIKKNSISTEIYKEIMTAENCKVVLLSGTPYINYPDELGVLFNLIGGYTFCLEVTIQLTKSSIEEKAFKKLLDLPFIESFEYEQKTNKLKIIQNPYGFAKEENGRIKFDEEMLIGRDEFLERINDALKDNDLFVIKKIEYVKYKKFPESDFDNYFVTPDLKINNKEWFQSKITGMVSYLGDKAELMPEIIKTEDDNDIHIEDCDMSMHQVEMYSAIRNEERKLERRVKKDDQEKMSSTYRVFSRCCCNFAFPKDIPRPMPRDAKAKNLKITEEDLDAVENESLLTDVDGKYDESDIEGRVVDMSYKRLIDDVLEQFERSPSMYFNSDLPKLVNNTDRENLTSLITNSPKFYKILNNLLDTNNIGCHLLYTNFRQLEGIGILSIILKYYGFIELKIVKTGSGGYIIDFDKMYPDSEYVGERQYFALYTGTETAEQKEIIRNIYNSKFSALPPNIVEQINELIPRKEDKNMFGSIIKLLMITASGAEGIDLKNTRFVHITEPYWHHVRINQVIGRARRICSHADLPLELRNVMVFMYISKFKDGMDFEGFNALKTQDNSLTTDQSLFEIMERKRALSVMFLDTIKEASIDCVVNYKNKCVQKPFTKLKNNKIYSTDYTQDPIKKFALDTEKVELVKKTIDTDGVPVTYLVKKGKTQSTLYDYETYMKNKKEPIYVKVGTLMADGTVKLEK